MDRLFEVVEKWPSQFGQGLFMLLIGGIAGYTIAYCVYAVACALRGKEPHPPMR